MRAGTLRHRITIEYVAAKTQDAAFQTVQSWVPFASVWAAISPLTGKDLALQQSVGAISTNKIIIRYLPGLTTQMRIRFGCLSWQFLTSQQQAALTAEQWAALVGTSTAPRYYQINNIANFDERNIYMTLLATEYKG